MKTIAVICNNKQEWRHFVDTLQFTWSKDNKPYKAVAEAIIDIDKKTKYILVPNSYKRIDNIRGHVISDYVTMASIVDNDVHNYIMAHMRGDI